MIWTYVIIAVILLAAELIYFRIADKCNIIDKPNERSSHTTIVLRGGGVIFSLSMIVWAVLMVVQGNAIAPYLPFLCGLVLVCGISFWDDVRPLPDSVRLVVQFVATGLMFWGLMGQGAWFVELAWYWKVIIGLVSLIVFVGATDVINFMDGINGITAGYSLAVLVPLFLANRMGDSLMSRSWWWRLSACWCSVGSISGRRGRRSALRGMWGVSALRLLCCLRLAG